MNIVRANYTVAEETAHHYETSKDIYALLKPLFNPIQEEFYLLPTVGQETISIKMFAGAVNASLVDVKLIFHKLLVEYPNSYSFLIAHNHPSGNCEPSKDDFKVTENVKASAELLGYKLIDHIIFSNSDFYSFHGNGRL